MVVKLHPTHEWTDEHDGRLIAVSVQVDGDHVDTARREGALWTCRDKQVCDSRKRFKGLLGAVRYIVHNRWNFPMRQPNTPPAWTLATEHKGPRLQLLQRQDKPQR